MKKKITGIRSLLEYLFEPWEIVIYKEGVAEFTNFDRYGEKIPKSKFYRNYVIYKHTHKFVNKEKLIKEYVD